MACQLMIILSVVYTYGSINPIVVGSMYFNMTPRAGPPRRMNREAKDP
jgi:hypothetical protein